MIGTHCSIPSAQEQLQFLQRIQQLLNDSSFTSTYKFALLLAITELSVEMGQDNGESLAIPIRTLAEKTIELYWQQTLPTLPNTAAPQHLSQLDAGASSTGVVARRVQRPAHAIPTWMGVSMFGCTARSYWGHQAALSVNCPSSPAWWIASDFQAVLQMPFWWQSPPAVVDTTATVHHGQMPLDAPQSVTIRHAQTRSDQACQINF